MFLLIVFNALIILQLRKAGRNITSLQNRRLRLKHTQRTKVTLTLALVSLTFVILNIPWLLFYLTDRMPNNSGGIDRTVKYFLFIVYLINLINNNCLNFLSFSIFF